MSERIEPGADAAHRDDLARDVARAWVATRQYFGARGVDYTASVSDNLAAALDRLADAYGEK